MKERLGVVIVFVVLFAGSVLAENLPADVSKNIVLNDGSVITRNDAKSLTVNTDFQIISTGDMVDVGDIKETREWGYIDPGSDTITSDKELEIFNDEYVCIKKNTKKELLVSVNDDITINKIYNPTCIHYPKKYEVEGKEDNEQYTNLVTITQKNKHTVIVDYPFENYDPMIVNYTSDCSTSSGCTINAVTYSLDMTYGAIQNLKAINSDKPDLDWCLGGDTSSCSALYTTGWKTAPNIPATCVFTTYSDYLYMNCSTTDVEQHFYFYSTYIKTEVTAFSAAYRYYWYTTLPGGNSTAYTDTEELSAGARWTDSDSTNGVAGIAANTNVASTAYNTTYMFAVAWNQSIETDFSYGAGVDNSGLALFRSENVPANTWMTTYIKVIPRIELYSNMTQKYTNALTEFKNNPTYGDSTSGIINYTGGCDDNMSVNTPYYTVTLNGGVITSFIYYNKSSFDFATNDIYHDLGQVYDGTMRQSPSISSNCTIINTETELQIRVYNNYADSTWTFYPTYIKRTSTAYSAAYRDYFYTKNSGVIASVFNSTQKLSATSSFVNVKDKNGVAGINYTDAPSLIVAVSWDESKTEGFGYQSQGGAVGISVGRGLEIPANTILTSYIKVIPEDTSATGDTRVTNALLSFKNDPTYGDLGTASESEARTAIENAILQQLPDATIDTEATIYTVSGATHNIVKVDIFASYNNKRWGFNYLTGADSSQNIISIPPSLYFWQGTGLTTTQITQQVTTQINNTK